MRRSLLASALALSFTVGTAAAQTRQVTLTGAGNVVFNNVYVGPYTGTSPGLPTLDLFCVDFLNSVRVGNVWNARFTSLSDLMGGLGLGNTRFGQKALLTVSTADDATTVLNYRKAAWLAMQFAANGTGSWGGIHQALWNLFTPTSPNWLNTTSGDWRSLADAASTNETFDQINWNSWYVVTDVNTVGGRYGKQEYLTYVTPEPETLLLLATGLAAVLGYAVASRRFV